MTDKKAFVFDTNFIIEKKNNMVSIIEELKNDYNVYAPQVCIDERIAQECRGLMEEYQKVEDFTKKYNKFGIIEIKSTGEEILNSFRNAMMEKYQKTFCKKIIPFPKDNDTLLKIFERANQKIPPFPEDNSKNKSDKGFKDCLLWVSLLSFFKEHGENEVVFVTNDKAFLDNKSFFLNEFHEVTGKKIGIEPNSYCAEIIQQSVEETPTTITTTPIDINSLREQIDSVINSLCEEGYYSRKIFTTTQKFDKESTRISFENMENVFQKHLLEKSIPATLIFENSGIDIDEENDDDGIIPINNIENAIQLFKSIKNDYPQYMEQFLEAAVKILNRNYREPRDEDEDEFLPF
ncbi:DUF4935 domain-containing protein [bacterium]|nr:DUF4935 domain-containing protein [bacterium]